ncbi:MAG TPA: hypothetical protein VFY85_01090 [Gemmatimonadaceae bacterium]|nr:hypothetical protein [Gemmatimonadaceae bacterium]
MRGTWQRGALAALLFVWSPTVAAAHAQVATVSPVQGLSFGLLLPGAPETVPLDDVARRGVVALAGTGSLDVTFVLPAALVSPEGGSLPLSFSTMSAGLLQSSGGPVLPFDPQQLQRVQLATDRVTHLVLGGTAQPATTQRAGHYTARILVIVSQPGT